MLLGRNWAHSGCSPQSDVQRQEAVVPVITMLKRLTVAVDAIVGGVKVQGDPLGGLRDAPTETISKNFFDRRALGDNFSCTGCSHRASGMVQPVERALSSQRFSLVTLARSAPVGSALPATTPAAFHDEACRDRTRVRSPTPASPTCADCTSSKHDSVRWLKGNRGGRQSNQQNIGQSRFVVPAPEQRAYASGEVLPPSKPATTSLAQRMKLNVSWFTMLSYPWPFCWCLVTRDKGRNYQQIGRGATPYANKNASRGEKCGLGILWEGQNIIEVVS